MTTGGVWAPPPSSEGKRSGPGPPASLDTMLQTEQALGVSPDPPGSAAHPESS